MLLAYSNYNDEFALANYVRGGIISCPVISN